MKLFDSGIQLNAIIIEEDLKNCEGRIIFGDKKSVIKVNSTIPYVERKRFVIAHEIGHLVMHKGMQLPDDTFHNFNIIEGTEKFLKFGQQELEANEFASELLMPTHLFKIAARGKKFSPQLIKELATRFKTSLTSVVFKYLKYDLHPICVVQITNGKVRYWKKSTSMNIWVGDITKLPPPGDSVAMEYIQKNYEFVYSLEEKTQKIKRSTWFELRRDDYDSDFNEYCIPTKAYQTILSIIWED
jgi:Zn-dependent peptidase ImmA (M78 family)